MVVVCWIIARILSSHSLFVMVYASAMAVGVSWLSGRRPLKVQVTRSSLPSRIRVGQMVIAELEIIPSRRLSTIVLEENIPGHIGGTVSIPIDVLKPGSEMRHPYVLTPRLRGVYNVGPTVATWSDPFGLTIHRQVVADPVELIVHPSTERVHDRVLSRMWEDPPIRPPRSKPWPVGFEFYGMREYVPGDDIRRVVWSTLAKTGKVMVRESEQGITDRILIVIDADREWHSPGEPSATLETAVRVAASLAVRHLEDGFSVTLLTNEGRLVQGARGKLAHLGILDELAKLGLSDKPIKASEALFIEELRGRPHTLFLSAHLTPDDARRLKLAMDTGASVVVANLLWEESDPVSLSRAASLGCQVIQVPTDVSLESVFSLHAGIGTSRWR